MWERVWEWPVLLYKEAALNFFSYSYIFKVLPMHMSSSDRLYSTMKLHWPFLLIHVSVVALAYMPIRLRNLSTIYWTFPCCRWLKPLLLCLEPHCQDAMMAHIVKFLRHCFHLRRMKRRGYELIFLAHVYVANDMLIWIKGIVWDSLSFSGYWPCWQNLNH